jgi:hypothetical protein
MRRFVFQLAVFVFPLLLGALAIDYVITSSLRKSKQGDLGVWNDLANGDIKAELLIYGSSRAWVHFDTRLLEDSLQITAYNLGADGYDFNLQEGRHALIMKYNTPPKIIIVALDYFMFTRRALLPNPAQFLPHLNDPEVWQTIQPYGAFDSFDRNIPAWKYIGYSGSIFTAGKMIIFPEKNKPDRYHGYAGQNRTWSNDLSKAKAKKESYYQQIDTVMLTAFQAFVTRVKKEGINLVFVYPPEYVEGQSYVRNRSEILNLFSTIAEQNSIPYFDYSTNSISFNKAYFYNSQHLNKAGARVFTTQVLQDLELKKIFSGHE